MLRNLSSDEYQEIMTDIAKIVDNIDIGDLASCLNKAMLLHLTIDYSEMDKKRDFYNTTIFDKQLLELIIRFKIQVTKLILSRGSELQNSGIIQQIKSVKTGVGNTNGGSSN
jgi:hypothetical protein